MNICVSKVLFYRGLNFCEIIQLNLGYSDQAIPFWAAGLWGGDCCTGMLAHTRGQQWRPPGTGSSWPQWQLFGGAHWKAQLLERYFEVAWVPSWRLSPSAALLPSERLWHICRGSAGCVIAIDISMGKEDQFCWIFLWEQGVCFVQPPCISRQRDSKGDSLMKLLSHVATIKRKGFS